MTTTDAVKKAKDFFYNDEYEKARDIFIEEKENYGAGLCSLLLKDEKSAYNFWKKDEKISPACAFGLCVLKLIHLNTTIQPTFFQTRAQLEIYINLFLKNELLEWAENLISSCDFLFRSNPESYKFIARALYSNGYFNLAITFCKKSLKFCYWDPEAFLILSQCYFLTNKLTEAKDCIERTLEMSKTYFPAKIFKKVIDEKMAQNS